MKSPAVIIGLGGDKSPSSSPPVGPMAEGGSSDDESQDGSDSSIYVPISTLAQPDDQEQMQTPEVGDEGDLQQVHYKVTSIEGDQACITLLTINGKPLDEGGEGEQPEDETGASSGNEPDTEGEENSLRDMASSGMR